MRESTQGNTAGWSIISDAMAMVNEVLMMLMHTGVKDGGDAVDLLLVASGIDVNSLSSITSTAHLRCRWVGIIVKTVCVLKGIRCRYLASK